MQRIYKYELPINDRPEVWMPKGAKILCICTDPKFDRPYIWALVDPNEKLIQRFFRVVGTGNLVHTELNPDKYVGTFMMYSGEFIGHVFYD